MNTNNSDTFEKLRKVVAKTFRASPDQVTPETAWGQLPGWDSMGHLTLMMEVEREFSVVFPTEKINDPQNVGQIRDLLVEVQKGNAP